MCGGSPRYTVRVHWIWELRIYMLKESPRDTKAESPGELVFGNYGWKVSALLMMIVVMVIDTGDVLKESWACNFPGPLG